MDFSRIELSDDDQAFRDDLQAVITTHLTEEACRRDRETGDNFAEGVYLALGAAGYLKAALSGADDGGFTRLQRRIWTLQIQGNHVPFIPGGTTAMVAKAVQQFGSPELIDEVMPGVFSGANRFCLGYTEPDGGSDIATIKTRAVRDGGHWVINGSKMFTTGAHVCQYVFLLTNTDPTARKHKSLTMFLVPLNTEGIDIQGMRTVDGDRTNIVYYTDVRVDDKYRLGEVNDGWTVLRGPLDAEHGAVASRPDGLQEVAIMEGHTLKLAEAVDSVAASVATPDAQGHRRLDDQSVAYRLGRATARLEAALSTPSIFGRVASAQTMRELAPELMDLLGAAAALRTDNATKDISAEYLYRWAPLCGVYGGTLEVFRNMIAQHVLGLGRPAYGTRQSEVSS